MALWRCPDCDRPFSRRGQTHLCRPGRSLEDFLDDYEPEDRAIVAAVQEHLDELGDDVELEAVDVGVFFIRRTKFIELRPRRRGLRLTVKLRRDLPDGFVVRSVPIAADRWAHMIDLETADAVDDEIRGLIAEGYAEDGG